MPLARQYVNRAAQQAAYRARQALAQSALLRQKGLPPLPAIPSIAGHARWRAMIVCAQRLLSDAAEEMQSYHDARSEVWQESVRAEELLGKMEQLAETLAQLEVID